MESAVLAIREISRVFREDRFFEGRSSALNTTTSLGLVLKISARTVTKSSSLNVVEVTALSLIVNGLAAASELKEKTCTFIEDISLCLPSLMWTVNRWVPMVGLSTDIRVPLGNIQKSG